MRDNDNFWSTQYQRPVEATPRDDERSFWLIVSAQDIAWIEHCQRVSEDARASGF